MIDASSQRQPAARRPAIQLNGSQRLKLTVDLPGYLSRKVSTKPRTPVAGRAYPVDEVHCLLLENEVSRDFAPRVDLLPPSLSLKI
jgi:hypothetical protein